MPAYHLISDTKTGNQWNVAIGSDHRTTAVPGVVWQYGSGAIGETVPGREWLITYTLADIGSNIYQGFDLAPAFTGGGGDTFRWRTLRPYPPAIAATPSPGAAKARLVPTITASRDPANLLRWLVDIAWPSAISSAMQAADLALHGCTLDSLTETTPGLLYRATVTPTGYGSVGLAVRPRVRAAADDGRQNDSTWWAHLYQPSQAFIRPLETAPQTNVHWYHQTLAWDIVFPRDVTGLELADLEAENLDTLALTGSGSSYRVTAQPTVERGWTKLRVTVPAASDCLGNGSPLVAEWASYRDPSLAQPSLPSYRIGYALLSYGQVTVLDDGVLLTVGEDRTQDLRTTEPQTDAGPLVFSSMYILET